MREAAHDRPTRNRLSLRSGAPTARIKAEEVPWLDTENPLFNEWENKWADVAGRVLEQIERKEIRGRVISIAAIAEADDALGREPGEYLYDPGGYN